ncbi:uroporphyrinogen-III synthase HemD [Methanobrevibacter ruminantium M1]|uniref:Uroporphyrinogen-III synthase HemD n=1 Tax=Methanobrevibacter ruminantium (strain ATCC 35063 / DSM 1093 / JCM 13430 / OCM 146 / M1) TaxID=634498 RepID=D3E4D3_METRM|nr:uroporphyrinogen-III synthase [Methanobrevibacter ruminantium]ADC47394.1 uroporphyrinogen-III synthase HemD [Methanobrevibacter ruminantium M1]
MKKKIAITRPQERSKAAKEFIENYGSEAIIVPTLELKLENTESLKNLMEKSNELDWLIFTSVSSIESIFEFYPDFLDKLNPECKIATIGTKTAELGIKKGLPIDIIPKDYTAEGLLEEFERIDLNNKNVGVPRTFSARTILPEGLKNMGANVILAESYKSVIPEDTSKIEKLIQCILDEKIDGITFTSPLTVSNLFEIAKDEDKDNLVEKLSTTTLTVAIGPITGNILNQLGVNHIYPKRYTVKDMIDLMFRELNNRE